MFRHGPGCRYVGKPGARYYGPGVLGECICEAPNAGSTSDGGHLPECFAVTAECVCDPDHWGHLLDCPRSVCICAQLRACEQRVRNAASDDWYAVQSETWVQGYLQGLQAAREAVEHVSSLFQPLGPALAAIDALGQEKQ